MATADIGFYGVWLSDEYLDLRDLDLSERVLLAVIAVYAKMKAGVCWLSNANLAEVLRCSEREIQKRLGALIEAGYVSREIVAAPGKDGGRVRHLRLTDRCPETVKEREQRQKGERSRTPVHHLVHHPVHHLVHHPVPENANAESGTPFICTKKKAEQAEAPIVQEAVESCNPPQPACLPADSALTAPTGDERQAALVAFGATADEARAILSDDAALPLSRLQGWIAEYGVRTARGNAIARPIAWLRTCLRSGEAAPAPPSAPAPAAEDPHGEWSMEKRIRMTAAIEQRDRREAEERTRAAHEAMQQMLARLDAARAARPVGAGDGALRP